MDYMNYYVYVYVYFDPRSHEEFYYGKGQGDRESAHLKDRGDSGKASRIRAISEACLEPIVRVGQSRHSIASRNWRDALTF